MSKRYEALDVNNKLIWNFRDIGHILRHHSEGKGSQKRILMILKDSGPITQRVLTEVLGIRPGSASEVIGKLETAGLIVRSPSESDRRTTDVRLTEKGRAAAEEARAEREARHMQLFACLSDGEKQTLLSLLEKVNLAWGLPEEEPEDEPGTGNCRKGRGRR